MLLYFPFPGQDSFTDKPESTSGSSNAGAAMPMEDDVEELDLEELTDFEVKVKRIIMVIIHRTPQTL